MPQLYSEQQCNYNLLFQLRALGNGQLDISPLDMSVLDKIVCSVMVCPLAKSYYYC